MSCPAGHTRPITKARSVTFGALCRACPLAKRCTTSKTGRTLTLHERDDLLRAARRDWATDTASLWTAARCSEDPMSRSRSSSHQMY